MGKDGCIFVIFMVVMGVIAIIIFAAALGGGI